VWKNRCLEKEINMKTLKFATILFVFLIATLSCEIGGAEFDPGIELTTCSNKCGEQGTCQSSRGDLAEKAKVNLSFPFGGVTSQGARDYPENTDSVNITLNLSVEGEGSARVTIKTASGGEVTGIAKNGSPVVLTETVKLTKKKTEPSGLSDNIESASIEGIKVESVDGPATGVQVNISINDCTSPWCTKTHPNCQ
jgi:hypothetical protein